ncbi:MAG: OmpA family protein [Clostridia bacterium]
MARPLSDLATGLVRLSPAYKFFLAGSLAALAACAAAPDRRGPWAGAGASDQATQEPSAVDERLAHEARAKEEAALEAQEAQRQAQIERERSQAAAAELAAARDARALRTTPEPDLATDLVRLQGQNPGLDVRQSERGWVLTAADSLLFDAGAAALKPTARRALDSLAQLMRRHPDRDIAVEGFTDADGPDEANRVLSQARALAVRQALIARGIDAGRIDARGYGASFPVASNDSEEGRQLNRRLEIVINPS